jgi:hypothetical protein
MHPLHFTISYGLLLGFLPVVVHGFRCESCKKRWADEVGGEIPESPGDERWEMLLARRRAWMGEFAQVVTDKTRELCPGVTVEHNFSSAASPNAERSVGDEINDACDYTGETYTEAS